MAATEAQTSVGPTDGIRTLTRPDRWAAAFTFWIVSLGTLARADCSRSQVLP
jgi:hypothetical protein